MTSPYGSPPPSPPPDPWSGPPSAAAAHPAPAAPGPGASAAPPSFWAPTQPTAPPHAWGTAPSTEWAFPAAPPPPSTNGWAVTALVTGLIGLVPVAVPAGIAGIVQTTRRRQAGRGLAIAGLVAAALWTVGAVVLIAMTAGSWDPRAGTPADVGTVAVGDCLEAPAGGSSRWTPVACTEVHDAEVYVVEDLEDVAGGDGGWPGEDEVELRADDVCHEQYADYVGASYFSSAHDYSWFTPRVGEWADGERRLVCVVVPFEDDVLRAPVGGSGE